MEQSSSQAGSGAKVPIPRLKRVEYLTPKTTRKPRTINEPPVGKACNQCRKRKSKCSGQLPRCLNCQRHKLGCHYDQRRKDRLQDALQKNQTLTKLLSDVSAQLDDTSRERIEDALRDAEADATPLTPPLSTVSQGKRPETASSLSEQDDRSLTSGFSDSVGYNDNLDSLKEDVLRNPDASRIGYLGRSSHAQWLRAFHGLQSPPQGQQSDISDRGNDSSRNTVGESIEAFQDSGLQTLNSGYFTDNSFYPDNTNIDVEYVDTEILPPLETAEKLWDIYKEVVNSPFQFLDKMFEMQFRMFFSKAQAGVKMHVCTRWKAILNLVFAIGARYSRLTGADWQADDRDHHVYMWRAIHLLDLKSVATFSCVPDLSLIRALGLLSFYYLTIGHVSKAWHIIGVSLRFAQAAGLHLRLEDSSFSKCRKVQLTHTWWALFSIESILTAITGRPRAVASKDCTADLPDFVSQGRLDAEVTHHQDRSKLRWVQSAPTSSSSSTENVHGGSDSPMNSFAEAYVEMDLIMDEVLSTLYSTSSNVRSWMQLQGEISSLTNKLEQWASRSMPQGTAGNVLTSGLGMSREHVLLHIYYKTAEIFVTRPCLYRHERSGNILNEDIASFIQQGAEVCVQAACTITTILPDAPNPRWFYETGPWWSSVHVIMQAATVLLLYLLLSDGYSTIDKSHVMTCVERLSLWLKTMMSNDALSERAYNALQRTLNRYDQTKHVSTLVQPDSSQTPQGQHQSKYSQADTTPATMETTPDFSLPSWGYDPALDQTTVMDQQYAWPPDVFNSDFYSQANYGNFDLNPTSQYFQDPSNQAQADPASISPFFGADYTTNFDQNMEWDPTDLDGWPGPGETR